MRLAYLLALVLGWAMPQARAQSIQTILSNGPPANRFNLVVLSEGYTSAQLDTFRSQATNMVDYLLSHHPYSEYRGYFNAFAISVASAQSGSDHPSSGIYANTYFSSTFDSSDHLITIPTTAQGQGKVDALLQSLMPACNLSILLVNDPTPGGSDGSARTAIVSVGTSLQSMSDILAHETGHVVAGLGDEYEWAYPGYPDAEEPNTTRETSRDLIKWKNWISPGTPVPTPLYVEYGDVIGLFEGAHYHSTGWYRPKMNCAMRDNISPFCEVCSEALILALYHEARPIDAFRPAVTNISISTTQSLTFALDLLRPSAHSLSVQWFTNGVPIPGATGNSLMLRPTLLPDGSNSVSALVRDDTLLVRTDPSGWLTQTQGWTVIANLPHLRMDSPAWLAGPKFAFRVSGNAPNGFVLSDSTNLVNWRAFRTSSLVNGQFWYTNSTPAASSTMLYRANAQ